ncbi:MAG TPA: CehA/McbA family metallohydrolase [Candidatus Limnocylindrales bacterium]|nr:CehA/McbA family metallohydrolase [Candidatus Limnocylindrales bacterium]
MGGPAASPGPGQASGADGPDIVLEGSFGAADQMRYVLVPFEVPAGVHQLEVAYTYSDRIDSDPRVGDGNTLDIGLFDPRGTETGSPGFRGWSGSHKDGFVVGESWATPPYSAGPIPAGTWNVLLGPYKVGPRGCDYRVEIRLDPGRSAPAQDLVRTAAPVRPSLPPARPGWLRGDLHCHTRYSDGDSWPSEMLHAAAEAGLEFLGVTDHNNVAHHAAYGPGGGGLPIVVPGVEVTTYGGHWNAWGTDRWWEFREPTRAAVERAMAAAVEHGATVSVNHPKPYGPPWTYNSVGPAHAIEVWNGAWGGLNVVSLATFDERLRAGQRLAAVGGSDTHILRGEDADPRHAPFPGTPTTWVEAGPDPSPATILGAIRRGRTFVSASPAGPQLYLDRSEDGLRVSAVDGDGSALLLVGADGVVAAASVNSARWSEAFRWPGETAYVRAQLVAADGGVVALTSPVWRD